MDDGLSDSEAGDRLSKAQDALGDEPGASVAADTALSAARKALRLISLGLIVAGEEREAASDPPAALPRQPSQTR